MPARLRRPWILALLLSAGLIASGSAPAGAATPFSRDLFFAAGYERQVDSRTCTAASTAMMMNFIAGRDLRLNQRSILAYAQPRDALSNAVQRGSDPLGWSKAATYYSRYTGRPTTYKWEAYTSAYNALRRAATQIAITGKPVGLLVAHGSHAIVMTGFSASANPAKRHEFTLDRIWVSDPYGYSHRSYPASASPLNMYAQMDATAWYDLAWYRKYVIVVPQN